MTSLRLTIRRVTSATRKHENIGGLKSGVGLASLLIIGALSFSLIVLVTPILGHSVLNALVMGFALAMPIAVGKVVILCFFSPN